MGLKLAVIKFMYKVGREMAQYMPDRDLLKQFNAEFKPYSEVKNEDMANETRRMLNFIEHNCK